MTFNIPRIDRTVLSAILKCPSQNLTCLPRYPSKAPEETAGGRLSDDTTPQKISHIKVFWGENYMCTTSCLFFTVIEMHCNFRKFMFQECISLYSALPLLQPRHTSENGAWIGDRQRWPQKGGATPDSV